MGGRRKRRRRRKEWRRRKNDYYDEDNEKKRALSHTKNTIYPSFSLYGLQLIIFWMQMSKLVYQKAYTKKNFTTYTNPNQNCEYDCKEP